jgi:hypothetical protein
LFFVCLSAAPLPTLSTHVLLETKIEIIWLAAVGPHLLLHSILSGKSSEYKNKY